MTGQPHLFDPTVLRAYDVRGIVGATLNEADAVALGLALGTMIRERGGGSAALGRDGRLSSPMLEEAAARGLMAAGLRVVRIGMGATPMLYYAVYALGCDGGMQITGSHNPPEYNGFKMMLGASPVYGAMIERLGDIAAKGDYARGEGRCERVDLLDRYVDRLVEGMKPSKPLCVAWDSGNGSSGPAMVKLAGKLPGRHILLNERVDGRFPAHHPDPTVEKNLVQLKAAVAEHKADLGIGFDGDGDRIGIIDGQGRVLWGDQILALLARPVLAERPGAMVISDVKASQTLFDDIAAHGGRALMWRTGHSLIKAKMQETGAPLAGEMSGHIFFADRYYGFDDALYAAVRMIEMVGNAAAPLAVLRDSLPQTVNTPELRFACSDARKFAVIAEVEQRLAAGGADMSTIDGVRVRTADGWWLLRASNTQDVLVARCEAGDAAGLARLKACLAAALEPSGIRAPEF